MTTITSAHRNNIIQLFNKPVESNKSTKSSQSEFASSIENIGIQDAAKAFIKLPSQTSIADKLFDEMASQGLPDKLFESHPGWKGEAVRNMLGIIYKDAQPEDMPKFEKVFHEFGKADDKFTKDAKVAPELSFLFHKYGESALRKHMEEYTQHCRNAWEYQHDTHNANITDEDIFTPGVMACYDVLNVQIKALSEPEQSWATIISSGTFFKDTCAALSKALKYHDAAQVKQPSPESSFRNIPQNSSPLTPEFQQSDIGDPGISIPAGNGHGPITIHNTANGGNGISTVNGSGSGASTPASDIDFGIALLNTPDKQLGNEKARLVEKFMDLHWERAQNGGQDKFSDHLDSVVQDTSPEAAHVDALPSPQTLHTIESFVSISAPQFATVIDTSPQQVMGRADTATVAQPIEKNDNVLQSNQPSALALADTGKNLQSAVLQVAQALSGLLTEADPSLTAKNILKNTSSEVINELQIEPKKGQQPTTVLYIDSPKNAANSQSRVQQRAHKFEKLNTEHQIRNASIVTSSSVNTASTANRTQLSRILNSDKSGFQPLKLTSNKFKFDVSVNQTPAYTTNRTIDPFSRHSADLKHLSNSFDWKPEAESEESGLNSDLVNSL